MFNTFNIFYLTDYNNAFSILSSSKTIYCRPNKNGYE